MEKREIKFGDLVISEKSKELIKKALDENWVSGGHLVTELEEAWGKIFWYKHNVAVTNGADADTAACLALYDMGAERGDEIIVPSLAFASVGSSVLAAGLRPVFVDIERETLNINPAKIEEKITPKTKAIL